MGSEINLDYPYVALKSNCVFSMFVLFTLALREHIATSPQSKSFNSAF